MEASALLQCFNSFHIQRPLTNKKPRHLTNFSLVNVAETPEPPLSASVQISCSNLYPLHDLRELKSLNSLKETHAQVIKMFKEGVSDDKIGSLISNYLELDDFQSAAKLFLLGSERSYLHLNLFIEEFKSFGGDPFDILEVFGKLHKQGVKFNGKTLCLVMKICANVMDLWLGLEVHACLIKRGFNQDEYAKYALMNFYDRFYDIDTANQVFYETQDHESLVWNEAILLNLKNKKWIQGLQLFSTMQHLFVKTNSIVMSKVLQACAKSGALDKGKQIHGYVIRNALESNILICNSMISMYMKNNSPVMARAVFDLMANRNLSSWNSIISGYTALGYTNEAWKLFQDMQICNIKPDIITWNCLLSGHFLSKLHLEVIRILRKMQNAGYNPNSVSLISVLQAVSELGLLNYGKEIHCYMLRNGFDHEVILVTSLLDMYVKTNSLEKAKIVFDNMQNNNTFAWNTMVSGHASMGNFKEALSVLDQMEKEGIKPDLVTYNILISGYSVLGCIKEASAMINQMKNLSLTPDVVSWTALISGCSKSGYYNDALKYSTEMQKEGIRPNSATLASLIRCCAGLSWLQKGKEIHSYSIRNGLAEDVFITTALIDMYCKSGSIKNGYEIFSKAKNKRLASWNCIIRGFALYSYADEANSHFHKMSSEEEDIHPDSITFTAILSSCRNSGLIDQGWKYFDMMQRDYNIIPSIEHHSCMVDLLGRAGYVDEAWDIIQTMELKPDVTVWGGFLGACQIHGNLELGKIAAMKLFELEPQNPANYISLMNLYAAVNKWEEVEDIKQLMKIKKVKFGHLWSWIQINQTIHLFSARGKPHPDEGEIQFEMYQLITEMKTKMGYVPAIECVYQNIDAVEKEKVLFSHTEKLAITYGLMKIKSPAPIRVIKNTRVCSDCHTVAKYISLLRNREIFIKDGLHFHHFSNGKCCCNDFW